MHKIIEVDGLKQSSNFQELHEKYLKDTSMRGATSGFTNNAFTPFPKRYKNIDFLVVLSSCETEKAILKYTRSGFRWKRKKDFKDITSQVFAWTETSR